MKIKRFSMWLVMGLMVSHQLWGQSKPYRVGTTTANFLEMGVGSAACAMGEAQVAVVRDLSSVYWNPAGLSYMTMNEVQFVYQPWIAGINLTYAGAAFVMPQLGTFGFSFTGMNYGQTQVTSMEMQEGTGEMYSAMDFTAGVSYARKLAQWFGFGASFKYVSSGIWHMKASAAAVDMGVLVNTGFFSPDGKRENGLTIGMSIANYGTKMKYDGMDLLQPIDISTNQGNYADVEGQFRLQGWELPLILRIGVSVIPIKTVNHQLCLAVDALHPNNNCESINVGGEYQLTWPAVGKLFLRSGYRGLAMDQSEYGWNYGGGVHVSLMNNRELKMDYAYKSMGILGNYSMFTIGMTF
jgi:hypothetical protein